MKKHLFLFSLSLFLLSCEGFKLGGANGVGGGYDFDPSSICIIYVTIHENGNCEGSPIRVSSGKKGEANAIIDEIEVLLSQAQIGECVYVNLGSQLFSYYSVPGEPAIQVSGGWIVNDENKSWLEKTGNCD